MTTYYKIQLLDPETRTPKYWLDPLHHGYSSKTAGQRAMGGVISAVIDRFGPLVLDWIPDDDSDRFVVEYKGGKKEKTDLFTAIPTLATLVIVRSPLMADEIEIEEDLDEFSSPVEKVEIEWDDRPFDLFLEDGTFIDPNSLFDAWYSLINGNLLLSSKRIRQNVAPTVK